MFFLATLHYLAISCAISPTTAYEHPHPLSDEFINLIETKKTSWKAGRNFPVHTSLDSVKKLMGALKDEFLPNVKVKKHHPDLIASLPDAFDARDKWPDCPTLNEIRDQGSCSSCWAFAAVGAMTDRYCIHSNGARHFRFSAQDLVSCSAKWGFGCSGGFPSLAWEYWKLYGIVSGGAYNSSQDCRPYEIPPCEHYKRGLKAPCNNKEETPPCVASCRTGYNIPYSNDKRFGKSVYSIKGEDHIKAELYKNGPIEATFIVFCDFLAYKTGVYKHTQGNYLGGHAVKILGWGEENGNKYWLVANSWNSDWGDNGFFKILRGADHCGIESSIVAGEPLFIDK